MTRFLQVLGCLFISHAALGASLRISKLYIGQPFYRTVAILNIESPNPDPGRVSVVFKDAHGLMLENKNDIKVKRSDYSCTNSQCSVLFYELPISLEKHTCSLEIRFSSLSGELLFNSQERWGHCQKLTPIPETKFLPDLHFTTEAYFSNEASIEIKNSGSILDQKNLYVWGLLRDKLGEIIWDGQYQSKTTLKNQESINISLGNPPKAWQKHLACTGNVFIDSESELIERTKLNNSTKVDFGNCEEPPSEAAGDKIDFVPVPEFKDGILVIEAKNDGRLPFLNPTTSLEVSIHYLGPQNEIIFSKTRFIGSRIYGFGDSKFISENLIPDGVCTIVVELNPNLIIKEDSYINNRISLNICE